MRPTSIFSVSLSVMALAIALSLPANAQSIPGCDPAVLEQIDKVAAERGQEDANGLNEFHKKIKDIPTSANGAGMACVSGSMPQIDVSSITVVPAINAILDRAIKETVSDACRAVRDQVRELNSVYTGAVNQVQGINGIVKTPKSALGGTGNPLSGLGGSGNPSSGGSPISNPSSGGPFDGVVDLFRPKPKPPASAPITP